MSITRDLEINISNGEAKLSEDIFVYQNDRGVELRLKLNLIKTNYHYAAKSSLFETSSELFAAATILKPNGDVIPRKKVVVVDNIISFVIDKELTDNIDEIGIYKIQFHLYDVDDNRLTMPPIQFEVKELIGEVDEDDLDNSYAIVDVSKVDSCVVAEDRKSMEIFSNGKYIKTVWNSGDLITAIKLNKIEEAIETLDSRLSGFIVDDNYINIETISYSNDSDASIATVKDALDKLLYVDLSITLNSNTPVTLEKGRVVEGITFSWNYNKKIVAQTFNYELLDPSVRNYLYGSSLSLDKMFILTADDGVKDFTKSISFKFLNGIYWGVSSVKPYDSNFINSLSKELSSRRNKTFTVNCLDNQYVYYCIPTNFGTPTFTVGGFSGGFDKVDTIEFNNIYGYVESYDIYKSTNGNLGNTTVVVS